MNKRMQRTRDAALDILKPSPAELEHGLELHANSVVFDAYGFAPRTSADIEILSALRDAGASDAELVGALHETNMTGCVTDEIDRPEYMEAWETSGVTCVFQNAGQSSQNPLETIRWLAHFTYVADMMRGFLKRAVLPDDIIQAKKDGEHCMYFSANGVPLSQQWLSVEEELRYIRIFFQLGARMMHLTYNRRNMIGDGCAEDANAGLSDFGRAVVREMNRVGVIVDVAHSGWQTSREAAQVSERPMVASHSACAALSDHMRCEPDNVIRAIADTGGYIGICGVAPILGLSRDISALLDHVDHVAKKFGVEHVAIGLDVAYNMSRHGEKEAEFVPRRRRPGVWHSFWPAHRRKRKPGAGKEKPPSLAWTNWPMFTIGLVQRGYSDQDIQRIIGGNVLRVAQNALPDGLQQ